MEGWTNSKNIATKEDLWFTLRGIGRLRLRPDKLLRECDLEEIKESPKSYAFMNPVPNALRKIQIKELIYTDIEWQMLTLQRAKNYLDEALFTRYIELARLQAQAMAEESSPDRFRVPYQYDRSWRLCDRWIILSDQPPLKTSPSPCSTTTDYQRYQRDDSERTNATSKPAVSLNRIIQRVERLTRGAHRGGVGRRRRGPGMGAKKRDAERTEKKSSSYEASLDSDQMGHSGDNGKKQKGRRNRKKKSEPRRPLWCEACAHGRTSAS